MKRINIRTPGIVLNFRDIVGIRTPTFIDVDDKDIKSIEMYLSLHGISDYTINPISEKESFKKQIRIPKTGMKEIILSGTTNKGVKLSIG